MTFKRLIIFIWRVIWDARGMLLAAYCLSFILHVLFIGSLHYSDAVRESPSMFSHYRAIWVSPELRQEDPFGFNFLSTVPFVVIWPVATFLPCCLVVLPPYLVARWIGRRRARAAEAAGAGTPGAVGRSSGRLQRSLGLLVVTLGVAVAIGAAKVAYLHDWSHQRGQASIYANHYWSPPDSDAYRDRSIDLNLAAAARLSGLDVLLIALPTLGLVAPFYGAFGASGGRRRAGVASVQRRTSDLP